MAINTNIQWCDSTVNPVMGCDGCELWPTCAQVRNAVLAHQLRRVKCRYRGVSIEPLWEQVSPNFSGIDWVIVGGESGGGALAFDLEWARSLRNRCQENDVAFFVKQLGARPVENGQPISLTDAHGGDWSEWPEDLRVRKLPTEWARVNSARVVDNKPVPLAGVAQ